MMTTHLLVPRRSRVPVAALAWRDLDRAFDRLWSGFGAAGGGDATRAPRIDFSETDTEMRVAAELPGLDDKDIEVSLEHGVLTIRGERTAEEEREDAAGVRHRETFRGKLARSLRLPNEVDAEAVTAVYRNGVLTVTLPKAPTAQVRSIPITGS